MVKSTSDASDEMSQDGFLLVSRKISGLSAEHANHPARF